MERKTMSSTPMRMWGKRGRTRKETYHTQKQSSPRDSQSSSGRYGVACRTKTWGKRDGDIRVADNVGRIKKELLVAIGSGSNKETIIKMASALESCSSISTDASLLDLNGRWSLLYSTQTNSGVDKDKTTIDKFLAFLYKGFFLFAPRLAGSKTKSKTQRDVKTKSKLKFDTRNEQFIDIEKGIVMNAVELFQIKDIVKVLLCVNGIVDRAEKYSGDAKELAASVCFSELVLYFDEDLKTWRDKIIPKRLEDEADNFSSFKFFRIPLPNPRGSLTTTFIDDTLRISKGGKGGLFIAARC